MRSMLLLLIGLLWAQPVTASVDIKGFRFEYQRRVADSELLLSGTAVLTWALFLDVYVGGLYLPAGHPGSRWTDDVPKLLELSYLRNFTAQDFIAASDKLLQEQLPQEQYQTLAERLRGFYRLFRDIKKGDRYSLLYHPTTGTALHLNGQPLGQVPGHDFAVAYFGLWLGAQPISSRFRDQLLSAD